MYTINVLCCAGPAVVQVAEDNAERLYPNPKACPTLRQMSRQVPSEIEEFPDYVALVKKIQAITGSTPEILYKQVL